MGFDYFPERTLLFYSRLKISLNGGSDQVSFKLNQNLFKDWSRGQDLKNQVKIMAKAKLGRGLEALLSTNKPHDKTTATQTKKTTAKSARSIISLGVDQLVRGRYQPRRQFDQDKLDELANSIAHQGIIQPLVVRQQDNHYEIVAGERRWRAAQQAGLGEVPVVVRDIDDQTAMAFALIENIQRDNLNPLEMSRALLRLSDEFDLTHQEIANAIGKSRATVTNLLRLNELQEPVKTYLIDGKLEMGHARALVGLKGEVQNEIAHKVVSKALSVRETERLVSKTHQKGKTSVKMQKVQKDPNIRVLEQELMEKLGARVEIKAQTKNKGRLVINYNSLDELEGVLAHIH